ncbi:MAG TPA: DUF2723 domain-containing protein [Chloroflexia bacterium]|nr:DUF2723 domain-containing protein [Chloroflexia bacterium]
MFPVNLATALDKAKLRPVSRALTLDKTAARHWLRLLLLLTLLLRLLLLPGFIDSGDGVFFVRGVRHYATYELSPHWPGYPVYIWAGQLFHLLAPDPVLALHLLAALATSLSIWPLALFTESICREAGRPEKQAYLAGLSAGLAWALLPLSWQAGAQINSDALALPVALLLLWCCRQALRAEGRTGFWLASLALLSGLLPGIRLSYVALLGPVLHVLWARRGWRSGRLPAWLILPGAFLASGLWLGWQWLMEGTRFLEAGERHLAGHYQSWGGSLLTDPDPLTRPFRLFYLLAVYGLGGWWPQEGLPLSRLPLSLLLTALTGIGLYRLIKSIKTTGCKLLLLWLLPYLLWVLVSHDLNIARYCLPLVAGLSIVLGLALGSLTRFYLPALLGLLLVLVPVSLPLALEYRASPPPGERLAAYLNAQPEPSRTALLMLEKRTSPVDFLAYFVAERAPATRQVWTTEADFDTRLQALTAEGFTVYTALSSPAALSETAGDWILATELNQTSLMDSLTDLTGSNRLWVYRYYPPGWLRFQRPD